MNYPFSLYGQKIKIHRFRVDYAYTCQYYEVPEEIENGQETLLPAIRTEEIHDSRAFPTREEAERFQTRNGGEIQELDTSEYEWIDGIEIKESSAPYDEAIRIYAMGQTAYEAEMGRPTQEEQTAALEQQVTDLQMALCEMYETMEVMMS